MPNSKSQQALQKLNQEYLDFHSKVVRESYKKGAELIQSLESMISGKKGLLSALKKEKAIIEDQLVVGKEQRKKNDQIIQKIEKQIYILKKLDFNTSIDDFNPEYAHHQELNQAKFIRYKEQLLVYIKPKNNPEYAKYLWPIIDTLNEIIITLEKLQASIPLVEHFRSNEV